jgi:outer membrane protein assembly factor BamB
VDDAGLRVFEEDGSVTSTYSLGGIRTQPVQVMDNGKLLAISTNEGITLLHIGGQPQFVQVVTKPALENGGPLASATDNAGLVTGDALGVLRLYEVENGGLTPRWQAAIPEMHKASGPLVLSPTVVVAVDDQHVIHLFDRSTGAVTRSYPHPSMISVPPLVMDGQLVVLDVSGALTSYQLSR